MKKIIRSIPEKICKVWAPKHLTDVNVHSAIDTNRYGFSAPYLLVKFKDSGSIMEVTHFDDNGRHYTYNYFTPISEDAFIKRLRLDNPNPMLMSLNNHEQ